jgi:hypothetical protein
LSFRQPPRQRSTYPSSRQVVVALNTSTRSCYAPNLSRSLLSSSGRLIPARRCPLVTLSLSAAPSRRALPFHRASPPRPRITPPLLRALSDALSRALRRTLALSPMYSRALSDVLSRSLRCTLAPSPSFAPSCSHFPLVASPSCRITFSLGRPCVGSPLCRVAIVSGRPYVGSPLRRPFVGLPSRCVAPRFSRRPLSRRPCLPWPPRTYISFAKAENKRMP